MDYRQHNNHRNPALYEAFFKMPKIELHRHLEGSLRLGTMADIAKEYNLDLPGTSIEDFRHLVQIMPDDSQDAPTFLSKFKVLRQFFRSEDVIKRIAYEIIADAAAENIVYFEMRFTPMALASESGHTLSEVTDWVLESVKRAEKDFDLPVSVIISMNRHEPPAVGDWTVEVAIDRMEQGVVAVDLAGDETQPSKPFAPVFEKARKAGLNVTIHGGEWAGPESAAEAVNVLGATRLGHGVRLPEDKTLFKALGEKGIHFEVCPTSNVQSGVISSFDEHPIKTLYAHYPDLVTINSDDPSLSGINLSDELVYAVELLGMSPQDIQHMMLNAARCAFLPKEKQDILYARIKKAYLEVELPHLEKPPSTK